MKKFIKILKSDYIPIPALFFFIFEFTMMLIPISIKGFIEEPQYKIFFVIFGIVAIICNILLSTNLYIRRKEIGLTCYM